MDEANDSTALTGKANAMIEGLKVTIKGTELRTLCASRAAHHVRRASEYRGQSEKFGEEDQGEANPGSNVSPAKTLRNKADEHAAHAAEMKFIAEHLVDSEDYQLEREDLHRLGIVTRPY